MRLDVYHHFPEGDDRTRSALARIESLLQEGTLADTRIEAALSRMDAATTDIAGDIRALKDRIGTGMSQVDVDAVSARLEEKAAALEAIGGATDPNVAEVKAAAGN